MKLLNYFILFLFISATIFAQEDCRPTVNGQFVNQQLDLTNMTYSAKLQINTDIPFIMEQVKTRFTFNIDGLDFINVNVLNFNPVNGYDILTYLSQDGQKIWVEIDLQEGQQGYLVGTDFVDFLEFNFTILDQTQWSNICLFAPKIFRAVGVSGDLTIGNWPCDDYPLPVELTSFMANQIGNEIQLTWTTATETNNYGFNVQRNGINVGFVPGYGNSNSPKSYSFTNVVTASGTYVYRLQQIDNDGTTELSNEVSVDIILNRFELSQNYPNPFNPTTTISFFLNKSEKITLAVYDVIGNQVAVLADGIYNEGYNEVVFNANDLSSGLYIYKLQTESDSIVKKMTLLK